MCSWTHHLALIWNNNCISLLCPAHSICRCVYWPYDFIHFWSSAGVKHSGTFVEDYWPLQCRTLGTFLLKQRVKSIIRDFQLMCEFWQMRNVRLYQLHHVDCGCSSILMAKSYRDDRWNMKSWSFVCIFKRYNWVKRSINCTSWKAAQQLEIVCQKLFIYMLFTDCRSWPDNLWLMGSDLVMYVPASWSSSGSEEDFHAHAHCEYLTCRLLQSSIPVQTPCPAHITLCSLACNILTHLHSFLFFSSFLSLSSLLISLSSHICWKYWKLQSLWPDGSYED